MKRFLPFIIIVVVLGVAIGLAYTLYQKEQPKSPVGSNTAQTAKSPQPNAKPDVFDLGTSEPTPKRVDYNAAPPGASPPNIHGNTQAPVTIEEFGDYQCPPCRKVHPVLKQVEAHYGHRIRVIFRNLPLVAMHKNALGAAYAAEAAGLQGKFWEMHDKLYEEQDKWENLPDIKAQETFKNYAKELGLDVERFSRDMFGQKVAARVQLDRERANALGVTSTPTIFINGKEIPFAEYQNLNPAIDKALKEKGL
jgi:protein-disulfide isomerase